MSFLAVDKDSSELEYTIRPERKMNEFWDSSSCYKLELCSIRKLLGYSLTWKDEAVDIKK